MKSARYYPSKFDSLEHVKSFTISLLDQYDLHGVGFSWKDSVVVLGSAIYFPNHATLHNSDMTLELSGPIVETLLDRGEIIDRTIRHEIAHLLDYKANCGSDRSYEGGHGSTWRHYCDVLGIPGEERTADSSEIGMLAAIKASHWVMQDVLTGKGYKFYRRRPKETGYLGSDYYLIGNETTRGRLAVVPYCDAVFTRQEHYDQEKSRLDIEQPRRSKRTFRSRRRKTTERQLCLFE